MAVDTFQTLAESFITFVDGSGDASCGDLVRELERHLVDLYRAALDLALPGDIQDTQPASALTNDEAAQLQRRLATQLADFDHYSLVFDPYDRNDSAPVVGSLADDFADIYRDLKGGLVALRAGELEDATWQWKFGFDTHWGRHAAHALYALYNLRVDRLG